MCERSIVMHSKKSKGSHTASDPKTGNTKGHISSKAGIKPPDTK